MRRQDYIPRDSAIVKEIARQRTKTLSANALFLLAAFPYVSPINFGFDTQPYALLFSFLIALHVFTGKSVPKIPGVFVGLSLILLYATTLFVLSTDKQTAARSLAGYATLFLVTFASFWSVKDVIMKCFNSAVYVWLAVAVVQLMSNKLFGSFLVPRMSTSAARGVTSLAVEPSYYAVVCVFLLVLNDLFQSVGKQTDRKHALIMAILTFQMLLNFSGTGFLLLFVYLLGRLLANAVSQGSVAHLLVPLLLGAVVLVSFRTIDVLAQSRAGRILQAATMDPMSLVLSDASISDRLTHLLIPMFSLPYSKGIGLGLGTWSTYAPEISRSAGGVVERIAQYTISDTNSIRIMSGWGTAVFELGVFGILLIVLFVRSFLTRSSRARELSPVFISSGFTTLMVMFTAVPLAFPLFAYVFGLFLYYGRAQNVDSRAT